MNELKVYCKNCHGDRTMRPSLEEIAALKPGEWCDLCCTKCASIVATFSRPAEQSK